MKTTFYTFFEKTVLENIDFEGYDLIIVDNYSKVKEAYNIFKREYGHEIVRQGSEVKAFKEWLQGLPSVLTVPFNNYEILQNGLLEGFDLSTEDKEDKFLESYWLNLSKAFFTLKNNL
jgi:hypothetical protein